MTTTMLKKAAVAVAAAALVLSAFGCAPSHNATEYGPGVELPRGFHPLKGFGDLSEPGATYNGWPRYIMSEQDRMVMVYVPTQMFVMGGGTAANEMPARHVKVNHFYVDLHEVTNAQFDCFTRTAGNYKPKCNEPRCGEACDTGCETSCGGCAICGGLGGGCGLCGLFQKRCSDRPTDNQWIENELCYPGACFNPWEHRAIRPCQINRFREYWTACVNNNHPARNVSWREAWMYSNWSGKQLPSEAQWECAARGDDSRIYPWGNQETSEISRYLCNFRSGRENYDGYEYTAPVLAYAPGVSPYGAFNMAGNVWEWCGDWYDPGRYGFPSDEDPATGLQRGPQPFGDRFYHNSWDKDIPEARVGPMRGSERVLRGGSFDDPIERCRVTSRWFAGPETHLKNVGFRTILPLPPES
jgi:formylglycine-generating enzyme required for sulfatase activity